MIGVARPALLAHQVQDHSHGHQAREHPGVRGRGGRAQDRRRRHRMPEDRAPDDRISKWVPCMLGLYIQIDRTLSAIYYGRFIYKTQMCI